MMDRPQRGSSARATNLAFLRDLCARREVDVLSLDVFDTLLLRRVARPVDLFAVLGAHLERAGVLPQWGDARTFARLRREAEVRARERSVEAGSGVEVKLDEIYAELVEWLGDPDRARRALEQELWTERRLTFADPAIVEIVRIAHDQGIRVVLVSDTYFSAAHLEFILDRCLSDVPVRIFTSSDYRVGKADHLFELVLDHLDVEAHRVVHAGDNPIADVRSPRAVGMRAVHLTRECNELERALRAESVVLDEGIDAAVAPRTFDWVAGDFGLTALRLRAICSVDGDDPLAPYRRIGAGILGPVFTGFAEWVVREAEALGASRAYCIMREGAFLAPLIADVARSMGSDLEPRPLWLSRSVAARAAITEVDEPTIRAFLVRRRTPTPRMLAAALGVPARMLAPRRQLDVPLDDVILANRVVARIVGDPKVRNAVRASAAAARQRLERYLALACDQGDRELLLVDLGWNGTIQAGFDAALRALQGGRRTVGRYLATTRHIAPLVLAGMRARGFLADSGNPTGDVMALVRSPEVLEMVTLPAEGSVRDYTVNGEPVLEDRPVDSWQLAQEGAVRDGIRAFADLWGRCRPDDPRLSLSSAQEALRMIVRRFLARPTTTEFGLFAAWRHEDNFGSLETERLDYVDPVLDLRYVSASDLYRFPNEMVYWPAGVAAAIAPRLAVAGDLVLDGFAPEAVGDRAVPGGLVELELDSPVVTSPAWADEQRIVANPEARSLVRLVTIIPSPSAVRCRIRAAVESLGVDRIRLSLARRTGAPTVCDVERPAVAWIPRRGHWCENRLVLDNGEAVIELAPGLLASSDVYRTEVILYLRLVDDEVPAT